MREKEIREPKAVNDFDKQTDEKTEREECEREGKDNIEAISPVSL